MNITIQDGDNESRYDVKSLAMIYLDQDGRLDFVASGRDSHNLKVYFNQGWESEMEWKGEKYYLVHESDVKAILD